MSDDAECECERTTVVSTTCLMHAIRRRPYCSYHDGGDCDMTPPTHYVRITGSREVTGLCAKHYPRYAKGAAYTPGGGLPTYALTR